MQVTQPVQADASGHTAVDDGNASGTRYVTNGNLPPVGSGGPPVRRRTASEYAYGVDARLEIDPDPLSFPATQVGSSASKVVSVRNPDTQPHTLEPAFPVTGDPFGDFAVVQTANEILEPGASKQVEVRYQPSHLLGDEQTFQLATDDGLGPTGDLHVSGSGKDRSNTDTDARLAQQDHQRDTLEAANTNDPLHQRRVNAERSVREFAKAAEQRNESYADWTRNNVEAFLGKTGGDVHFEGPSLIRTLVIKGLSKGVGKMAGLETDNYWVNKASEKIIAMAAEYAFQKIEHEEKPDPEKAALDATEHVADQSNARGADSTQFRNEANAIVHDSESAALLRIAQAKTVGELEMWLTWGDDQRMQLPEAKEPKDRQLADELLIEWVKQRAATPTKAGGEANTKAWDQARTELAKSGKLPTLEISDLFIHQCRYEWSRIGMRDDDVEAAVAALDAKRKELEDQARASGVDAPNTALYIAQSIGTDGNAPDVASFHHSASWKQTAAAFADQDVNLGPDVWGAEFFGKRFDLTCHLHLDTKGAGVYVKSFWYSAESGGRQSTDLLHVP